mmetsp:Transcript_10570/g.44077  ORF Transcript_10570/g.44077 Transcript_10570/m.44077 type:complete len:109 (+) Transcript_10570:588-914(+)
MRSRPMYEIEGRVHARRQLTGIVDQSSRERHLWLIVYTQSRNGKKFAMALKAGYGFQELGRKYLKLIAKRRVSMENILYVVFVDGAYNERFSPLAAGRRATILAYLVE